MLTAIAAADFTSVEVSLLASWGHANRLEVTVEALGSDCADEVAYIGRGSGAVSWLFRTLRGGERPPGTTKVLMSKAILGWDGVEYHASHSQIGNRFFPQQINCLPFKLGGLPPRKVRKSPCRGPFTGPTGTSGCSGRKPYGTAPHGLDGCRQLGRAGDGQDRGHVGDGLALGVNQRWVSALISATRRGKDQLLLGPVLALIYNVRLVASPARGLHPDPRANRKQVRSLERAPDDRIEVAEARQVFERAAIVPELDFELNEWDLRQLAQALCLVLGRLRKVYGPRRGG